MARPVRVIEVDATQRRALQRLANAGTTQARLVRRARIVLARVRGLSQQQTAAQVGVTRLVVAHWERRFGQRGVAGLADAPGRGRKTELSAAKRGQIIAGALQPPRGRTRWSLRTMAAHVGVSSATVQRLWAANEIKPHRTRTFKVSTDPQFEARFWDVIGLYLNPPAKALVLCCDEKSQIQALQRTQPGLPLGIGHVRTRTHDYIRHGTVTLFAALAYLDGKIISQTAPRHTHQDWLRFLKRIDRHTPAALQLHLIADNYATHKHPTVRAWLTQHPRLHMHFTPTGSSWMNLVERFFRDLTVEAVRDGSFGSVPELTRTIEAYLTERNLHPKPYHWNATGAAILAKIERARQALAAAA